MAIEIITPNARAARFTDGGEIAVLDGARAKLAQREYPRDTPAIPG